MMPKMKNKEVRESGRNLSDNDAEHSEVYVVLDKSRQLVPGRDRQERKRTKTP
jgi:hypothetical protein